MKWKIQLFLLLCLAGCERIGKNGKLFKMYKYRTMVVGADDILKKYDGVKEFCKGGITVTGGEPLVQIDFVKDKQNYIDQETLDKTIKCSFGEYRERYS